MIELVNLDEPDEPIYNIDPENKIPSSFAYTVTDIDLTNINRKVINDYLMINNVAHLHVPKRVVRLTQIGYSNRPTPPNKFTARFAFVEQIMTYQKDLELQKHILTFQDGFVLDIPINESILLFSSPSAYSFMPMDESESIKPYY